MTEDLIDQLAETDHTRADEQAIRDFNEACKRVDTDPRERRRIRDIVDLGDADDLIYGQALAAIDRGDHDAAFPLLRRCAATGIGESAWLLATVLEELGKPSLAGKRLLGISSPPRFQQPVGHRPDRTPDRWACVAASGHPRGDRSRRDAPGGIGQRDHATNHRARRP